MLFWLIVARLEAATDVGAGQALFQALAFVTFVGGLGLPIAMARYTSAENSDLANWMVAARIVSAAGGSATFLLIAGRADLFGPLWAPGWFVGSVLFVVVAVGYGLAVLIEMRLVTLRLWGWVVGRSASVALFRLALLIPLAAGSFDGADLPFWLFVIATVPISVSGYVVAAALRLTADRAPGVVPPRPPDLEPLVRFAGVNWIGLVATQGPIFAVPLLVAFTVDSAENAPFYVAWSFGAMAFLLPQMIGQVTLSETNYDGLASIKLMHGLKLALLLTCLASIATQVGSDLLARLYGPEYGDLSLYVPLVVAASIPWSYTAMGLTASRVRERHREVLLISSVFFATTMVPAIVLTPSRGAEAAIWVWLAGNVATAVLVAGMYRRWKLDPENALVGIGAPAGMDTA